MNRVLVIEDEEPIAALLRAGLTASGCAVEVVTSGDAAVERVVAGDFDLVIIDIGLPGDVALSVVRALDEAEVSASVLVVAKREMVRNVVPRQLSRERSRQRCR